MGKIYLDIEYAGLQVNRAKCPRPSQLERAAKMIPW
jgi:hypothetical protein